MSSPVDTPDWSIKAWIDWVPTKTKVPCGCNDGMVGGHFKDMDGPRTCPTCHGSAMKPFYPQTPKPEVPKELTEHMRKAWNAFWEVQSLLPEEK